MVPLLAMVIAWGSGKLHAFVRGVKALGKNLYQKVWDSHVVGQLENGQYQVFMALHLIHEVTSPQAFGMLKDKGLKVAYPSRTFATVDHIIPTDSQSRLSLIHI